MSSARLSRPKMRTGTFRRTRHWKNSCFDFLLGQRARRKSADWCADCGRTTRLPRSGSERRRPSRWRPIWARAAPAKAGPRPSPPTDEHDQTPAVLHQLVEAEEPLEAAIIAGRFKQRQKAWKFGEAALAPLHQHGSGFRGQSLTVFVPPGAQLFRGLMRHREARSCVRSRRRFLDLHQTCIGSCSILRGAGLHPLDRKLIAALCASGM
ncbi:hypothetical protein J2W42_006474 [Rhizobium tibeticum]|nr:hypothetical protein [Rhizobium tibeticum]